MGVFAQRAYMCFLLQNRLAAPAALPGLLAPAGDFGYLRDFAMPMKKSGSPNMVSSRPTNLYKFRPDWPSVDD